MKKLLLSLTLMCLTGNLLLAQVPTWSVTPGSFTYSMTVTTKLNVQCVDLSDASDLIGAFVGAECRGVVNASNIVNGNYLAFLSVYSNSFSGETVTFKIYDASANIVKDAVTQVAFQDGAAFGFPTTPFVVYSNNQPSDMALTKTNVNENLANVFIAVLSATDLDIAQSHTYSLAAGAGNSGNSSFRISNDSLFTNGSLDFETSSTRSIRISTNDGECSYEEVFAIQVNDVNDAPTDITIDNNTIDENKSINTVVANLSLVDVDASDSHVFSLVAGTGDADNAKFSISGNQLLTSMMFDFEAQDTMYIRLQVKDLAETTYQKEFKIFIEDKNDAPTDISTSTSTFKENLAIGSKVLYFAAADQDASDKHTYTFDNSVVSNNALFTIVDDTLRVNDAFDFETKNFYIVRIVCTDSLGAGFTKQIILSVGDANDQPTDIALSKNTVDENQVNAFVAVISTTDVDNAQSHTYSFVSGAGDNDNAIFRISNDSLYANGSLDFETSGTRSVRLSTNDGALSYDKNFVIQVKDANDAPTDITIDKNTINENENINAVIANMGVADVDATDAHVYSLVSGTGDADNTKFTIVENQLLTNRVYDFEAQDTMYIRLQTTDSKGAFYQKGFTIVVQDKNDAPTNILLSTDKFSENRSLGSTVLYFSAADQDISDTHTFAFDNSISSNNASFTIVENTLRVNDTFDFETKNFYTIRVVTTDKLGANFTKQIILTVKDSNDVPTAVEINNQSVWERSALRAFVGKFTTIDQDAVDSHVYSLTSARDDNASFTISGDSLLSNANFDYNTKKRYSIQVSTRDAGALSCIKDFLIYIKDSNDAPTDIELSENKITENLVKNTLIGLLSSADVDSGDGHTYSLVHGLGADDNALFEISGNQLLSNSSFDFESKDTFSIRIQTKDFDNFTYQKVFFIVIVDANDTPTDITLSTDTISENLAINSTVITLNVKDQDAHDSHSYVFDNTLSSDNSLFVIVGDKIKTRSLFNYENTNVYFIYVTVKDASGTSYTKQFLLNIKNENDAPAAQVISNKQFQENNSPMTFVGQLSTSDEDANDKFNYTFATGMGDADNKKFSIVKDSLFVKDSIDFETKKTCSISVKSTDAKGKSVTQQYTINVVDANDIPTGMAISSNEMDENNQKQKIVAVFSTTDEDALDVHSYSLTSGTGDDNNALFFIEGNKLMIGITTNFETKNSYSILLSTKDGNGGQFKKQFSIHVKDVNEAPQMRDTSFAVSENAMTASALGAILYSDVDNGNTHTLQIVNEPTFVMDGTKILLNRTLDFEAQRKYILSVVVEDAGGLTDTAIVNVTILNEIELNLPLPVNKMMSPNGDGKNDVFKIEDVSTYADYALKIFNDAGLVIFNTPSNYDNSWGGTFNGELVEQGVYYYLLQSNTDDKMFYKGSVSIIR